MLCYELVAVLRPAVLRFPNDPFLSDLALVYVY